MPDLFCDDPEEYFTKSLIRPHHLRREEIEKMQLVALQNRFSSMRNKLAPLRALADTQGINSIASLNDAPPLFFPHTFFKSYPSDAIEKCDFPALSRWLSRFTLNDMSAVQNKQFDTLDAWMDAIDQETAVLIFHSSGTTGNMSFYPRGKHELEIRRRHAKSDLREFLEPLGYDCSDLNFAILWPSHASGRSAILRSALTIRSLYTQSDVDFHPLFPTSMSADYQHFILQVNAAKSRGDAIMPRPSPYVATKIEEAHQMQQSYAQRVNGLLDLLEGELSGQKLIYPGGPVSLYMLASHALKRDMKSAFAKGSLVMSYGGIKNSEIIDDLHETIDRFSGGAHVINYYGMTELSDSAIMCANNRFHIPPWIIPYILDSITGAPLPREGLQKGRAAFADLAASTYWGGIVSADLVEMSWHTCQCGRTTPHVGPDIQRIAGDVDSQHMFGSSTSTAILSALSSLN